MINSEYSINSNSNSNSKSIENEMSSYTMNVSAFERVMEREFASYLKHMNQLGLLSVSLKECRSALATGIAVEKKAKKSGRPKKLVRSVNESDIIADLTAKAEPKRKKLSAEEKAEKKLAKAQEKEAEKAKKALLKAKLAQEKKEKKALLKAKIAEEKKEKKRLEKEKKALEKAKAKAKKLAAKKKEAELKKIEREKAKTAKNALKKQARIYEKKTATVTSQPSHTLQF